MKKKKEKAIVKESRKAAKKELTQRILSLLSSFTIHSPKDKKTEKIIAKYAQQLAKRLSRNVTPSSVEVVMVSPPPIPAQKKIVAPKPIVKKEEPKV